MSEIEVDPGQTSSGLTVGDGDALLVLSGTAIDTTVAPLGEVQLLSGGLVNGDSPPQIISAWP